MTELLCLHVYGVKFQNVYNDYINCIYYGEKLSVYYHGITYLHASKLVLDFKDMCMQL